MSIAKKCPTKKRKRAPGGSDHSSPVPAICSSTLSILREWPPTPETSAHELLRPNPDQPNLPQPGILAMIQERQQQPHRFGVQRVGARQGLGRRVGAVARPEVGEPHGHRDTAKGPESLAIDTREDTLDQLLGPLEDEVGVERIDLERLLLADRFRLPLVRDRALGQAARFVREVLASPPEPLDEPLRLDSA